MSLKYRLNKTGPNPLLFIYCTPLFFVVIFEKPCLRKGNKGCMYVCISLTYRLPNKTGPKMDP